MQDRVRTPTAREYRRCLELVCNVHELLAANQITEARQLSLAGVMKLLRGGAIFWTLLDRDQKTSSDPSRTAIHGLEDWQLAVWSRPFLDEGDYVEHPLWESMQAGRGALRTARRADVVSNRAWYRHPHHERARSLGMIDEVVSMVPIGDDRECLLAVSRREGDGLFGERERHLLHAIHGALRAGYRLLGEPREDGAGRLRFAGLRLRLAPRFRPVLDQLTTGRSEKEIARALALSPRTVHKYAETVFRAAGVSSRIELLARLLPPLGGGAPSPRTSLRDHEREEPVDRA